MRDHAVAAARSTIVPVTRARARRTAAAAAGSMSARARRCRATASISRSACSLAPVISALCSSAKRHTVHAPTVSIVAGAATGRRAATGSSSSRSRRSSSADRGDHAAAPQHERGRAPPSSSHGEIGPFAHGAAMRQIAVAASACLDKCAWWRTRAAMRSGGRARHVADVAPARRWQRPAPNDQRAPRQDLRPRRDRGEVVRALGSQRPVPPRAPGRRAVHHRQPAAQRHRRAAHRPRARQHAAGRRGPLRAAARQGRAVGGRHRPRRHRHADGGRAPARAAAGQAHQLQPRGIRRQGVGVEGRERRHDHPPAAPPRLLDGLVAASSSPWTRISPAR